MLIATNYAKNMSLDMRMIDPKMYQDNPNNKPSDMEQRNGRAVRKGNWVAKEHNNNQVDVFIYATEKTLDTFRFNLLANKQLFINQIDELEELSRFSFVIKEKIVYSQKYNTK